MSDHSISSFKGETLLADAKGFTILCYVLFTCRKYVSKLNLAMEVSTSRLMALRLQSPEFPQTEWGKLSWLTLAKFSFQSVYLQSPAEFWCPRSRTIVWNSKAFPNRQIRRSSQSRRLQTVFITSWKGFPQKESEVISRLKTFKARISVDSFADGRVFRSQRSSDNHGKSYDGIQQKKDREHPRSQQKTAREVFQLRSRD